MKRMFDDIYNQEGTSKEHFTRFYMLKLLAVAIDLNIYFFKVGNIRSSHK